MIGINSIWPLKKINASNDCKNRDILHILYKIEQYMYVVFNDGG